MTPPGPRHIEPIAHLVPELKSLLEEKQWDILRELLQDISPLDLTESWYQFPRHDQLNLFKLMDPKCALPLFEGLNLEDQTFILKSIEEASAANMLENLPAKDVAELIHKLPKRAVKKMASLIRREDAVQKIKQAMTYRAGTAGSLMHPEFIKLGLRMTAKNALSLIQAVSRSEKPYLLRSLYVISAQEQVTGCVQLEDLISAPPDSLVQDLMMSVEPIKISPATHQEEVAALFSRYSLLSAPVVDPDDRILGIIVLQDIPDIISAAATEDIAKMAGTRAEEFRVRSVLRIAWFRAPFLLATLITQVGVSFVMRHFGYALQEILALSTFIPLVAAMGGNVGTQSATVFVRSLALGNLKGRAKYMSVFREAGTGLVLGAGYGLLVGSVAWVMFPQMQVNFYLVVGLSVSISMTWASIAGALGPILFEKIGIDPATAVGPMVTTLSDLVSITLYFVLAVILLLGGRFS